MKNKFKVTKEIIKNFFQYAYPNLNIKDIETLQSANKSPKFTDEEILSVTINDKKFKNRFIMYAIITQDCFKFVEPVIDKNTEVITTSLRDDITDAWMFFQGKTFKERKNKAVEYFTNRIVISNEKYHSKIDKSSNNLNSIRKEKTEIIRKLKDYLKTLEKSDEETLTK